jgi:superfamily II DNA/RNA helicase
MQAKLFNERSEGFDVLVASDAIGMGLNLNIDRIVFAEVTKFDGSRDRALCASELRLGFGVSVTLSQSLSNRQLGGRAGRGSKDGSVTSLCVPSPGFSEYAHQCLRCSCDLHQA